MKNIVLVRKFLVLILALFVFSQTAQVVYAQSFWSIYDEEEERKRKEEEARAAAEAEAARRAAAEAEAARRAEAAATEGSEFGSEWSFSFPEAAEEFVVSSPESSEDSSSEKVSSNKKSVEIKPNPDFAIAPGLGINLLQSPYSFGIHTGCDFLVPKMLEPFFYGGGFRVNVGFPKSDFPYTYELQGGGTDTPYLMGGNLTGIFGITYSPFHNNLKILLSTRLGLQLSRLVSFQTTAGSNLHAGIFANFTGGVMIYDVEISVTSEYDGVGKFSHGLLVAYRIPINLHKVANTGGTEKSHEDL